MMKQIVHRTASIVATLCIATFFASSVLVELFGSLELVTTVKSLIVKPGLFILVPAIALTGATGFSLSSNRRGKLVDKKKARMPFIALNGMLVLLPAAIYLNMLAAAGEFGSTFYLIQGIELIAGATNLSLMSLNIRDGLKLSGRLQRMKKATNHHSP